MLSSIGRASLKRVVVTTSKSTNRALQSLWCIQRANGSQSTGKDLNVVKTSLFSCRSYATTTTAGAQSSTTTTRKSPAKKTGRPRKSTAKKPIKKKKAIKKTKAKAKKKAVRRPKKKTKKVLTPEQKLKAEVKALKAVALTPPKKLPQTIMNCILVEKPGTAGDGRSHLIKAGEKYRSLSSAELEHYNHIANQNRSDNIIAYKKWVDSHTPDEIRAANNARRQLKRKDTSKHSWVPIEDPRIPKRGVSAYAKFTSERWASGDFKGIKLPEASKLILAEFKALSPSERKVYEDASALSKEQYLQEVKTVFHRDSITAAKGS